jgi:hypothetical protein
MAAFHRDPLTGCLSFTHNGKQIDFEPTTVIDGELIKLATSMCDYDPAQAKREAEAAIAEYERVTGCKFS